MSDTAVITPAAFDPGHFEPMLQKARRDGNGWTDRMLERLASPASCGEAMEYAEHVIEAFRSRDGNPLHRPADLQAQLRRVAAFAEALAEVLDAAAPAIRATYAAAEAADLDEIPEPTPEEYGEIAGTATTIALRHLQPIDAAVMAAHDQRIDDQDPVA